MPCAEYQRPSGGAQSLVHAAQAGDSQAGNSAKPSALLERSRNGSSYAWPTKEFLPGPTSFARHRMSSATACCGAENEYGLSSSLPHVSPMDRREIHARGRNDVEQLHRFDPRLDGDIVPTSPAPAATCRRIANRRSELSACGRLASL